MSPSQLARVLAAVYGKNIPDFDRALTQLYTPFATLVVDLGSTAGQSNLGDVREIGGDFIYVDPDQSSLNGSLGSVTIELNDKTNADKAAFTANPGFAINAPFTAVKLRYTNQPGKRLVLKYSTGYSVVPSFSALTAITSAITLDDPTKRDLRFGDFESEGGVAFIGRVFCGSSTGNFSPVQLKNPAASGVNVYVDAIRSVGPPSVGGRIIIARHDADLANLIATGINKNVGGGVSLAQLRNANPAALPWAAGNQFDEIPCSSSRIDAPRVYRTPIILGPGEGIGVAFNAVTNDNDAIFEWRELPV